MDGVNGENLLTASLRRDHEVILRALERLEEESDRLRYGRLERQD
jgi:hemerythrin-like domain-containing protein